MKFYIPFHESFNPFMFFLMEINPLTKIISLFFEEEPTEEELG